MGLGTTLAITLAFPPAGPMLRSGSNDLGAGEAVATCADGGLARDVSDVAFMKPKTDPGTAADAVAPAGGCVG